MKVLATVLLPLLVLLATPSARTVHAAPAVRLTVKPSAPRYKVGDKVALPVTLTNRGSTPATVSAFAPGSIRVVGLKRNGKPIVPVKTRIAFDEDPASMQVSALTTIPRGGHAVVPFDVEVDGTRGAILTEVRLGEARPGHQAVVYSLTGPGVYTFTLRYRYTGPDAGRPNVLHGTLRSNPVRLRVR